MPTMHDVSPTLRFLIWRLLQPQLESQCTSQDESYRSSSLTPRNTTDSFHHYFQLQNFPPILPNFTAKLFLFRSRHHRTWMYFCFSIIKSKSTTVDRCCVNRQLTSRLWRMSLSGSKGKTNKGIQVKFFRMQGDLCIFCKLIFFPWFWCFISRGNWSKGWVPVRQYVTNSVYIYRTVNYLGVQYLFLPSFKGYLFSSFVIQKVFLELHNLFTQYFCRSLLLATLMNL